MTITLTREEAQSVLDALDEYRDSTEDFRVANRCISLIETLRARLSAPEPEPVAWMCKSGHGTFLRETINDQSKSLTHGRRAIWTPLYTAPPQREWQRLTDEEIMKITGVTSSDSDWNVVIVHKWIRAIEQALKEKNNA